MNFIKAAFVIELRVAASLWLVASLVVCGSDISSASAIDTITSGKTDSIGEAESRTSTAVPNVFLDRIDFGNAQSEKAHNFKNGENSAQTLGVGAFSQTYRQPRLVVYPDAPVNGGEMLTFTMAVVPNKQNYISVKLYGSDTQFGVLKVLQFATTVPAKGSTPATVTSPNADADQLDNNLSNGSSNPPSYGLFHYATLPIPLSMTSGLAKVTLTLYSTGYFYDAGGGEANDPTRPVYSAFTHTNPYFLPPATDKTGVPLVVTGYSAPIAYTGTQVYAWELNMRGQIFEPGNQGNNNGFFHPGGFLEHDGICPLPASTPGVPPEVVGLSVSNITWAGQNVSEQPVGGQPPAGPPASCEINPAIVAAINASPHPKDAWRNMFAAGGSGKQAGALDVELGVYLLPPLVHDGTTMKGYDDYHDSALLKKIVGVLDGMARMQGAGGAWDSSCLNDFNSAWTGITTSPRQVGKWAGSSTREDAGCVTFEGPNVGTMNTTILRLLNDPYAAPLFKEYLADPFDVNLDGDAQPRAYAYERMLYFSRSQMGFNPLIAPFSNNYFDKGRFTTTQGLIFQQEAYSGQLALRSLQTLHPNSDAATQVLEPSLMKAIVRQFLGLDTPSVLDPVGVNWRVITAAGLGESHGTLSSGYDGRYGNYEAPGTGDLVYLSQWDTSLTGTDREQFEAVPRNCISAYDHFLYPQQSVSHESGEEAHATWTFAPDDVISYRVPYGPNANGANSNWFTQIHAADPAGAIRSPYALRSFYFGSIQIYGKDASSLGMSNYPLVESLWSSLIGVEPSRFEALPAEPGQSDFAWADIQNGAVAIQSQGERLFLNAQYNRPDGGINNMVRLHLIAPQVDREALVMMPHDATTVQDDGNLSGSATGAWVVRYGRYLVVLNNSKSFYWAQLPPGTGDAIELHAGRSVPMGSNVFIAAGSYEVLAMPR